MAFTPLKKGIVNSSTPLVNKSFSALMCQEVCLKKTVTEVALASELKDVTSIDVPIDIFMHKYFP